MKSLAKVTITFPTYNGWADTKECLKSMENLDYPKNKIEIIVVDNHSEDGTPELIEKNFPGVKIIKNRENLGYSKAVNIAVIVSKGKYVLFSNNDIVLDKNYLKSMVTLSESDEKIGVIGSMVYLKNPKGKIGFNGLRLNPYLGYHQYDLTNLDKVRECDIPPAGGFFVKRKVLAKIGLLDEGFFAYFEDVDFCLRAKHHGFKVMFNPKAIAYHGHAKTTLRQAFGTIVFQGYKSKWRCIFKNASPLQMATSIISQFTVQIVIENIRSNPKTYKWFLKGFLWNLSHIAETFSARNQRTFLR